MFILDYENNLINTAHIIRIKKECFKNMDCTFTYNVYAELTHGTAILFKNTVEKATDLYFETLIKNLMDKGEL